MISLPHIPGCAACWWTQDSLKGEWAGVRVQLLALLPEVMETGGFLSRLERGWPLETGVVPRHMNVNLYPYDTLSYESGAPA